MAAAKCVHQSCGKVFSDPEEECQYHPGPPVFHEGQKGWKCCKPRVLTFDEFLAIPPCTTGKHSTTDIPPPVEKNNAGDAAPAQAAAPPPTAPPRVPMAVPQTTATPPPPPPESESDDPSLGIADGQVCRRKACGQRYKAGQNREEESCTYHPGVPIFHEGSKGYTCCKRRVLEFDEFMKIAGCKTKKRHLFVGSGIKDKKVNGGEELVENVRSDFYQTPTTVNASFFLKKINKETASVKFVAPQTLSVDLPTTDPTPKRFKADIELFAPVDIEKSTYKILGTKLELSIVKADGQSWPVLRADDPRTGEIIQVGRAGRAT